MFLESAVAAGKIGAYGLATWNAFRDDPKSQGYLSLAAWRKSRARPAATSITSASCSCR